MTNYFFFIETGGRALKFVKADTIFLKVSIEDTESEIRRSYAHTLQINRRLKSSKKR